MVWPITYTVSSYIKEATDEIKETIEGQSTLISIIRSADDIAIITESERKLQGILIRINGVMVYSSMNINKQKTKVMACSRMEK